MASNFQHTLRSFERQPGWLAWLAPAGLLLAAWGSWLVYARVNVYATATRARLEVHRIAYRAVANSAGRIVALDCPLGRLVEAGQELARLDDSLERARLDQGLAALSGLRSRTAALRVQIEAEQARQTARVQLDRLATERAGVSLQRAQVLETQQTELTSLALELHEHQALARIETVNAETKLEGRRLEVGDAVLEVDRLRVAQEYEVRSQRVRLAELRRQLTDLESERLLEEERVVAARADLARRRIVASASGRLGSTAALQIGDVVQPGDVLATIIPRDDVHLVAEFAPDVAIGRVAPGQSARARLHGFAWTEFGMLDATVSDVANEPRSGTIRVELALNPGQLSSVPLQHGLEGAVDVRVERISPLAVVLRAVGARLPHSVASGSSTPYLARSGTP